MVLSTDSKAPDFACLEIFSANKNKSSTSGEYMSSRLCVEIHALSDAFGWKQGLHKKCKQAKAFYLIIAASTTIGLWINFTNIDPIQALVYTASRVINGITAVPILFTVMKIANDKGVGLLLL